LRFIGALLCGSSALLCDFGAALWGIGVPLCDFEAALWGIGASLSFIYGLALRFWSCALGYWSPALRFLKLALRPQSCALNHWGFIAQFGAATLHHPQNLQKIKYQILVRNLIHRI